MSPRDKGEEAFKKENSYMVTTHPTLLERLHITTALSQRL